MFIKGLHLYISLIIMRMLKGETTMINEDWLAYHLMLEEEGLGLDE